MPVYVLEWVISVAIEIASGLVIFLVPHPFCYCESFSDSISFYIAQIFITEHQVSVKNMSSCLYDNVSHLGTYEVCEPSIQHNIVSLHQKYKWNKRIFSCFSHHSHCFQTMFVFFHSIRSQKRRSGDISRLFLSVLTSVLKITFFIVRVC